MCEPKVGYSNKWYVQSSVLYMTSVFIDWKGWTKLVTYCVSFIMSERAKHTTLTCLTVAMRVKKAAKLSSPPKLINLVTALINWSKLVKNLTGSFQDP